MSEKTVIKIVCSATPKHAFVKIRALHLERETPKTFYLNNTRFSGNDPIKVKRSQFGQITHSIVRPDMIDQVYAEIYCYQSEKQSAKKRLLEFAAAEIQKRIDAGNAMMQKLEEIL